MLSRTATDNVYDKDSCLLLQPMSVSREELVRETRIAFRRIISAVRRGWQSGDKNDSMLFMTYPSHLMDYCVIWIVSLFHHV